MEENAIEPFLNDCEIDFDRKNGLFFLSCEVFSAQKKLPQSVLRYIFSLKNHEFQPYRTFYQSKDDRVVILKQIVPFHWGFQPSFREIVSRFKKMTAQIHHLLLEIAIEEMMEQIQEHLLESYFEQDCL